MEYKTTEKRILRMINEFDEKQNSLPINKIIADLKIGQKQAVAYLCNLFINYKIDLIYNTSKNREEFISVSKPIWQVAPNNEIDILGGCIEIISCTNESFNMQDFHHATLNKFKDWQLIKYLENCGASFFDLKILLKCITAFFKGNLPYNLLDLRLSTAEMLNMVNLLTTDKFIPQQQGLIEFKKEFGGFCTENSLSNRLVALLKNETIPPIKPNFKNNKGLYHEIYHDQIKSCDLIYSEKVSHFKQLLTELLKYDTDKAQRELTVLLHGPSGTGKTEFVYQFAKNIEADIIQLNFPQIRSKWIGETEKNVQQVFDNYQKRKNESNRPVIMLINEADGLMNTRVAIQHGNDVYHNQVQTQLLELLENFEGILFATTNLKQNIDEAFFRRFLYRQEIGLPDRQNRQQLLNKFKYAEYLSDDFKLKILEASWSPAQLANLEKKINQFQKISNNNQHLIEMMCSEEIFSSNKTKIGFL